MLHSEKTGLFNEWYKIYYTPLCKFITEHTNDNSEREDIVQETFVRVWRNIEHFGGKADPFTWICAIGINESRRSIEKRDRQIPPHYVDPHVVAYDEEEEMMADLGSPEEEAIADELAIEVARRLGNMPDWYGQTISMFYYDGMSYEEIGAKLGIPVETVRTRLRRGRDKLESFLGEKNEGRQISLQGG